MFFVFVFLREEKEKEKQKQKQKKQKLISWNSFIQLSQFTALQTVKILKFFHPWQHDKDGLTNHSRI